MALGSADPAVAPTGDDRRNVCPDELIIGLDVGSTTVKAVVASRMTDAVLWSAYRRHGSRQYEVALEFLERIEQAFPEVPARAFRVWTTGTGGGEVGQYIGAGFVQEVNAVCRVIERCHPETRSVIELGGEDAKILVLEFDTATGVHSNSASMNDRCAGGTGAVIDKIGARLGIPSHALGSLHYTGIRLHPVAGKCGVFAETDIIGLDRLGVPPEELMASLFDSIVLQNLAVLARGNTLLPRVLLLGGPNAFIPGMQECWRHHLSRLWQERGVSAPDDAPLESLVRVPKDAVLFAARGAVDWAKAEMRESLDAGTYLGTERLRRFIESARSERRQTSRNGARTWADGAGALQRFRREYPAPQWAPRRCRTGTAIDAFLGLDGGSTSTKAVALDPDGNVVAKAYTLSGTNPVEDAQAVLAALHRQVLEAGGVLRVMGAATTGYARDLLKEAIGADVALVETVAHMHSGLLCYPDADVICDVGGQDIKIILLKNGAVKDFRLNTQCSAGNGYHLQATAAAFGYRVEEYAEAAFTADAAPEFSHGCAVFLQSDVVDCQRRGWRPNEILAGLAAVLPKNVWLHVCQMPDLARLGTTFVLQGGVQRNLAAVKAQVDFIRARFAGTGIVPEVRVHPHCGETGAIGAAIEAMRRYTRRPYRTGFIGFDAVAALRHHARRDEQTRCRLCTNRCPRTILEFSAPGNSNPEVPRRAILANCDRGRAGTPEAGHAAATRIAAINAANPDLAALAATEVFRPVAVDNVADPLPRLWPWIRRRTLITRRPEVRIGMPRVLNLYAMAPFFLGYFRSLGVPEKNLVWSDGSSEQLFREGSGRGSIDPCYPSKVALAHVHNLLTRKHTREAPLTHIFFPAIDALPTRLDNVIAARVCPGAVATGEAVYAACVQDGDLFRERGIAFKRTFVDLSDAALCAHQMYEDWRDEIGVGRRESLRAAREGFRALAAYHARCEQHGRQVLDQLEREKRLGIVLIARPYHNDPGINHGICEEFQRRGYPILTIDSLPVDGDLLETLFGEEVAAGVIRSPLDIADAWKHTYAENTNRKVWAAKFVARHPHLIALELSSFKCGHDAPVYTLIEDIIEAAGIPLFSFRDIDENCPAASIRLRVETITYFLDQLSGIDAPPTASPPSRPRSTARPRRKSLQRV